MTLCCATLMCHAPIVIPQVGGPRGVECAATTEGMRAAARNLVDHDPDVVVLISPHAPRHNDAWGVCSAPSLSGDLARFGLPSVGVRVAGCPAAAVALGEALSKRGLGTCSLNGKSIDHGALVPLWFLQEANFEGAVVLVALPTVGAREQDRVGAAVRDACADHGGRWAVLASGDMSHALSPDAPAGFQPEAQEFDDWVHEHVARGDYRRAARPDPALRTCAAEDVIDSLRVAAAAVDYRSDGHETYSYEGPFGVGYLQALLYSDGSAQVPTRPLLDLARDAIEADLVGDPPPPTPALPAQWERARAVFVTLRAPDGELRGCIGRTEPLRSTLAEEIADCAVSAATRDPRMTPVTVDELPELSIQISVLEPPEPVADMDSLDPRRYGVVVSSGASRGVLLPDVPGVEDVEQQVRIAASKGHVDLNGPHEIERFQVHKIG